MPPIEIGSMIPEQNVHKLQNAILHDEPQWPGHVKHELPRDLVAICGKCLEKEPVARYRNAQELCDDLKRYLDGELVSVRIPTSLDRVGAWCRKNPLLASLSAMAVILALAFVGLLLYANQRFASDLVVKEGERNRANFFVYSTQVRSAWHAYELGDLLEAQRLLDACAEADRGWEHRLLATAIRQLRRPVIDELALPKSQMLPGRPLGADFLLIHATPASEVTPLQVSLKQVSRTRDEIPTTTLSLIGLSHYPPPPEGLSVWMDCTASGSAPKRTCRVAVTCNWGNVPGDADDPWSGENRHYCWLEPDRPQSIEWNTWIEIPGKDGAPAQRVGATPVSLAWHPSGNWLAGALKNGDVVTYDPITRKVAAVYENKTIFHSNFKLVYLPTGDLALCGWYQETRGSSNPVTVSILEPSKNFREGGFGRVECHTSEVRFDTPLTELSTWQISSGVLSPPLVECSPDGKQLVVATDDGQFHVRTLNKEIDHDGKIYYLRDERPGFIAPPPPETRSVVIGVEPTAIAFSGKSSRLAIGDREGWVAVWEKLNPRDVPQGKVGEGLSWSRQFRVKVSEQAITTIVFDAAGDSLFARDLIGRITSLGPSHEIPRGQRECGGVPKIWATPRQFHTGNQLCDFDSPAPHDSPLALWSKFALSDKPGELWQAGEDEVQVTNLVTGEDGPLVDLEYCSTEKAMHPAYDQVPYFFKRWISLAPRSRQVVRIGSLCGGWVKIWSAETGKVVRHVPHNGENEDWPLCCAIDSAEKRLYVGTVGGAIRILDVQSGQWVGRYQRAAGPIHRIDLADDGVHYCAIALATPFVKDEPRGSYQALFGRLDTGEQGVAIPLSQRGGECSLFSHDGTRFFTSEAIGSIVVYDARYGSHLASLKYPPVPSEVEDDPPLGFPWPPQLTISPDDQILAIVHSDRLYYWRGEGR